MKLPAISPMRMSAHRTNLKRSAENTLPRGVSSKKVWGASDDRRWRLCGLGRRRQGRRSGGRVCGCARLMQPRRHRAPALTTVERAGAGRPSGAGMPAGCRRAQVAAGWALEVPVAPDRRASRLLRRQVPGSGSRQGRRCTTCKPGLGVHPRVQRLRPAAPFLIILIDLNKVGNALFNQTEH